MQSPQPHLVYCSFQRSGGDDYVPVLYPSVENNSEGVVLKPKKRISKANQLTRQRIQIMIITGAVIFKNLKGVRSPTENSLFSSYLVL